MKKVYTLLLILGGIGSTNPSCLTVTQVLSVPSPDQVKKILRTQGGRYTDQTYKEITHALHTILHSGDTHCPDEYPDIDMIPHVSISGLAGFLSSQGSFIPSLSYTYALKKILYAWQTVHQTFSQQKALILAQEHQLISSPVLRTAQQLAFDTVVKLLLIIYSPEASPCERMHALYLLNTVNLMGKQGLFFRRFRARTNRFYFTHEGTLIEFDPSKNNNHHHKRIKALNRFLKKACSSRGSYMSVLKEGTRLGITSLNAYYQKAVGTSWNAQEARFVWRYAAGLFKELTTIDVMDIRTVDPERIFALQENRDFLSLMFYCSDNSSQEKVDSILTVYLNEPMGNLMKQYCKNIH